MKIDVSRLGRVFGDRILVKHLARPEKRGGLFVPTNYTEKKKETDLWYGEVVALGLDARYPDAYSIKVGDVLGFDALGSHSAGFEGDDGKIYSWVPEEFIACIDGGRIRAYHEDKAFDGIGLVPVGAYAVVTPSPIEDRRGGILLPQNTDQACRVGTVNVVSIGLISGSEMQDPQLKIDTEVLVGRYAGGWARLGKQDFLLVKAEDVIAELHPVKEHARA